MDGQNIKTFDISRYRRRMAIVHQEVDMFNGSIVDNLTYGNPNVSLAELKQACAIARVDDFIQKLPDKYNTIVGERGVRLSGGQKTKIGHCKGINCQPRYIDI